MLPAAFPPPTWMIGKMSIVSSARGYRRRRICMSGANSLERGSSRLKGPPGTIRYPWSMSCKECAECLECRVSEGYVSKAGQRRWNPQSTTHTMQTCRAGNSPISSSKRTAVSVAARQCKHAPMAHSSTSRVPHTCCSAMYTEPRMPPSEMP